MLTEQDIVLAQKRVSNDNLIRSIDKDYPNLFYLSICLLAVIFYLL